MPESACPFVSSPYESVRPSFATILPSRAVNVARSTCQRAAAWSISISRAVAAAFASCGAIRGVVCDPNVPASYGVLSVSAITIVMEAIGTRSSSATVCDSDVRMFWPISTLPVETWTRPASSMCSHAAMSGVSPRPCGRWRPDSCASRSEAATITTRPPPKRRMKSRRSSSNV